MRVLAPKAGLIVVLLALKKGGRHSEFQHFMAFCGLEPL